MENCEELNKELIERIKNEYEKADGITRESLERILPELKKPDDNEIREEILECIKYLEKNICHPARYTRKQYESWIAWVEKQGEQKVPFDDFKAKDWYVNKVDGKIRNIYHSVNKVEPKFKAGDWIIFNGLILHIDEVVNGYYRTISIGGIPNSYDWDIDNVARLWTMQDAKPGDILSDETTIFIFKDLLSDGSVTQYCDYDTDSGESDAFCPLPVNLMHSKITPATKEQHDLLFQKIKEAGYVWDYENLVLKKIRQRSVIKMKAPEESLGECIYGDDKSTWSKEDDKILNAAILHIKNETYNYYRGYSSEYIMQWLKSLKDRVQPKQECNK